MPITTVDGIVANLLPPQSVQKAAYTAEAIGTFQSPFYIAGRPGAAAPPGSGLVGAALTSYAGQIPFPAAVGGENIYLAGFSAGGVGISETKLCDRLWHNSGLVVTTTTAQTINSVAWPARDMNGSTNGVGVFVGIEASTATTNAGTIALSMSYTNDAGVAGRTATATFPITGAAGVFIPMDLQAGDTGVRSIQTYTISVSMVTGVVHLVAYREIATVSAMPTATTVPTVPSKDAVQCGFPRMWDNSVPFLLELPSQTAVGLTSGQVIYAQG